jgi:protein-S-isoprenylcysteine O-methyltransferase Ste14
MKRVVMSRGDIIRIVIVLAILAPLVVIQTGPGVAPDWMSGRWAGVPGTVIATTVWFIVMMALSAIFARQQVVKRDRDAAAEKGAEQ